MRTCAGRSSSRGMVVAWLKGLGYGTPNANAVGCTSSTPTDTAVTKLKEGDHGPVPVALRERTRQKYSVLPLSPEMSSDDVRTPVVSTSRAPKLETCTS